jgi:glutathione synthase/RimK-type ligase-like ATP-grasp enzyme
MSKRVVMVTHSGDSTGMLEELRAQLTRRGAEVFRFNTDLFPTELQASFSQESGRETVRLGCMEGEVILGPEDVIWYRRARWAQGLPTTMDPQLRNGSMLESKTLLLGMMAAAPCAVIDSPDRVRYWEHKPRQMTAARQLGLATPRTLATNDPEQARAFVASCPEGVIAKMLSAFPVIGERGEERVVFTTEITAEHLDKIDGLRFSPMAFQEKIKKHLELRITAVGSRLFTAAVDSQKVAGAEIDWRQRGVSLLDSWVEYELPGDVERMLARYMERTGMQYSAIDVLVEPGGRHVFLEANPVGECFWLQYNAPRFPLSETLASVLLGEPGARRISAAS